jgi:hypothetical protein
METGILAQSIGLWPEPDLGSTLGWNVMTVAAGFPQADSCQHQGGLRSAGGILFKKLPARKSLGHGKSDVAGECASRRGDLDHSGGSTQWHLGFD